MKHFFIIFVVFFSINSKSLSQLDTTANRIYYSAFYDDGKELLAAPLKWNGYDWLKFGGTAAGTYLFYSLTDDQIHEYFSQRMHLKDKLFYKVSKMYGEPLFTGLVSGGLTLYAYYNKDNEAARIAFEVVESLIYSISINIAVKTVAGRFRPYRDEGNNKFKLFNIRYGTTSFPSGHSTTAFSLSTVLAAHTENYFYKILLFTPAFFTAAQRMVQDQHWSSDVFAGAAIGYFVGNFLVNRHEKMNYFPFILVSDGENFNVIYTYQF